MKLPGGFLEHIVEQMGAAKEAGDLIEGSRICRRYLMARHGACRDIAAIRIARTWMEDPAAGWMLLRSCPPPPDTDGQAP